MAVNKFESATVHAGHADRLVSEGELDDVNGGLSMATYPVRAIRIFGLTAYVSNGELVGVGYPDGTVKPA